MAHRRNYNINFVNAVASPTATAATLTSTAAVRSTIFDLLIGASGTPADNALLWSMQRYTAAGTTTAATPVPLDSGDPACTSVGGVTATIEPTYTAAKVLWNLPLNQRASHRWIADPEGHLVCPATASNGIGLYAAHASYTGNVGGTIYFYE